MKQIDFIRESNKIEGILRDPTDDEIAGFDRFMKLPKVTVFDLEQFVSVCQPKARLRDRLSVPGVRVGNHIAPSSGPQIHADLENILENMGDAGPYLTHIAYETLHPFTDGNGRSGRALWAWQMQNVLSEGEMDVIWTRGFLHSYYYQSLGANQ